MNDTEGSQRRRRPALVAIVLLAVIVVAAVAYAVQSGSSDDLAQQLSRASIPPPAPSTTTAATTTTTLPPRPRTRSVDVAEGQIAALPRAPILTRGQEVQVFTGEQLLVWGGEYSRTSQAGTTATRLDDGAAFDAGSGLWEVLPAAPVAGRTESVAVWTGREMIVWGGYDATGWRDDGVAYDPATRRWRTLAPAPVRTDRDVTVLWAGPELFVFAPDVTLAYDPNSDRWRRATPAPIPDGLVLSNAVWTGTVAVFNTGLGPGDRSYPRGYDPLRLVEYTPATDRWSTTTAPDPEHALRPIVWTGRVVLVFADGYTKGNDYLSFDPVTGAFRQLPPLPTFARLGAQVWTGRSLVYFGDPTLVAFDTIAEQWSVVPGRAFAFIRPVWTGEVFLGWGGGTGAMYRPPRGLPT